MPARNVVVAQSGGPTCVINNSLRGIIETCRRNPTTFGRIFAGHFGIEGVLKEELLDLSATSDEEIALLRTSPAAGGIGTCRYKLKQGQDEDLERVVKVLKAHGIGYFFYIGGNDSQDTAHKVNVLAHDRGLDLIATGVPKTIDNDLGDSEFTLLDHSPGYGSVARYFAQYVRQANEENGGSCPADPVLVIQAMGRKIGFIPAAARLADPQREMPLQIYLTESGVSLEKLGENVLKQLESDGRCIVVVSEGFDVGEFGVARDNFGHVQYSSSQTTVAQMVVNYLNTLKFPVPGKARDRCPGPTSAMPSPMPAPSTWTRLTASAATPSRWRGGMAAAGWRRSSAIAPRARTTSGSTRCRWRRSPTPSGSSPNNGSRRTGTTCRTTSSYTPAP